MKKLYMLSFLKKGKVNWKLNEKSYICLAFKENKGKLVNCMLTRHPAPFRCRFSYLQFHETNKVFCKTFTCSRSGFPMSFDALVAVPNIALACCTIDDADVGTAVGGALGLGPGKDTEEEEGPCMLTNFVPAGDDEGIVDVEPELGLEGAALVGLEVPAAAACFTLAGPGFTL
jgi:hypothetical protein